MAIVFHHGSSVRLWGVIIGKLGEKEIREQRSENEGVTGGGRIYFGCGGLTGAAELAESRRTLQNNADAGAPVDLPGRPAYDARKAPAPGKHSVPPEN
jgi:hypothetical protein